VAFQGLYITGPTLKYNHKQTSPLYQQSNGKRERFHQTIKGKCIRPKTPLSLEDARRIAGEYIEHYNNVRLHSAIGYIAPADRLAGRHEEIFKERDRKLEEARELRSKKRQEVSAQLSSSTPAGVPLTQAA